MIIVDIVSGKKIAMQNVTERLMNALIRQYLYSPGKGAIRAAEGGWSKFGTLWDVAHASETKTLQLVIERL